MFKAFQSTMIIAAIVLAFGAGYLMKPAKTPQEAVKHTEDATPVEEVAPNSAAVDIRIPVGEMTPAAKVEVNKQDITFKWIQKELGIETSILDPKDKDSLTVLQPFDKKPAPVDPKANP